MIRTAFILLAVALVGGCEDTAPEIDAGVDASIDHGVDAGDLSMPRDLAEHLVALPPPTALVVALVTHAGGGLEVRTTWASSSPRVRLLRRADAVPLGPFDATASVVYEGPATEWIHPARDLRALAPYFYAAFACDDGGGCEAFGVQVPFEITLVQGLLDGGYAIYLRHAIADQCSDDLALGTAATTSVPDWWKSCDGSCATATAQQLGASGLSQAASIGQALALRAIPFDQIRSSEFCRARTTAAALALSGVPISTDTTLTYFVYDEATRCDSIAGELPTAPAPGTNRLLVGHADFPGTCDPLAALQPGEAAVFRATGTTAEFIQLVSPTEWATLP